jgi:phosphatidylglycerol:prolipoprotein diacylglycerol transferase
MYPFLHIHLLGWQREQPTFGLMLWLAIVVAAILLDRSFRRSKVEADAMSIVVITAVAGVVGAKLWHVIDTPMEFRQMGWQVLWDTGGLAWFGGLTFGLIALILQGWWTKIGALRILDLTAPAAAMGYGVGRIGCLLSGDGCYGIPTQLPWGMAFPNGIEPTMPGVRVHPTPLYEFLFALVLALWLWKRGEKARPVGALLGEYLLLSGIARFLVEFLRRNPKVFLHLSNAQLASLASVLAGGILILLASRRKSPEPVPDAPVSVS